MGLNSHNRKWTDNRKENANNNKNKHYNGEWKNNVLIVLRGTQGKNPTQMKTNKKRKKRQRKQQKKLNIHTLWGYAMETWKNLP